MYALASPTIRTVRRAVAAVAVPLLVAAGATVAAPAAVAAPSTVTTPSAVTDTGTGEVSIMAYAYDVYFVGWSASVYGEITAVDPADEVPTGRVRVISHEEGNPTEEAPLIEGPTNSAFYSDAHPAEIGTRQFTVEYSGDENFAPASATFDYVVHPGPDTATTLTADPSGPITVGQSITFTARVTDSQGRPLTGDRTAQEIIFYDNGEPLEGEQVSGEWEATLTTSSLSVGTHRITAESSALFYEPSTSNEIVVEVLAPQRRSVKGTLFVWPSGVVPSGTTVQAVAEFHPRSGSGFLAGEVQFYDFKTKIGGPVTLVDGVAHRDYGPLPSGPHLITARYLGTAAYSPALTLPRFVYVRR